MSNLSHQALSSIIDHNHPRTIIVHIQKPNCWALRLNSKVGCLVILSMNGWGMPKLIVNCWLSSMADQQLHQFFFYSGFIDSIPGCSFVLHGSPERADSTAEDNQRRLQEFIDLLDPESARGTTWGMLAVAIAGVLGPVDSWCTLFWGYSDKSDIGGESLLLSEIFSSRWNSCFVGSWGEWGHKWLFSGYQWIVLKLSLWSCC